MRVQVTKTFARFINKTAKEMGFKCTAKVVKGNKENYTYFTGDEVADGIFWGDYEWDTGYFRVLQVVYPPEYYACVKYVTTKQLQQEFKRMPGNSMEDLKKMIRNMFEV